jgi:fructosamine-3-kinase
MRPGSRAGIASRVAACHPFHEQLEKEVQHSAWIAKCKAANAWRQVWLTIFEENLHNLADPKFNPEQKM